MVGVPGLPETGVVAPLIDVVSTSELLTLSDERGMFAHTNTVTNPGAVALSNVRIYYDKCSPMLHISGDTNGDSKLDVSETWTYTCQNHHIKTTTSTVMVSGEANGLRTTDYAVVTCIVPVSLSYPKTLIQQIKGVTVNLGIGSVGDQVRIIQEFLIFENKGPAAVALGAHGTTLNFGLLTQEALLEWQKAVGIPFATGNFGQATRDYISEHNFETSNPSFPDTGLPLALGFTGLSALNLKDGDTVSAISSSLAGQADPDIYIVNSWGYKRLFLNPIIFGFYGHLGGFASVRKIVPTTRDVFVTSGFFRNCETGDPKVYGLEITGEDVGTLHWINTTGEQAVADDSNFFKKVFCINNNEFNWYQKGIDYTSVNQVPAYLRVY